MKKCLLLVLLTLLVFATPGSVLAQTYKFEILQSSADVYWNDDGTMSIYYEWVFKNHPSASPIDYIDVGLPNDNYDIGSISAEVDGQAITDIQTSPYVKPGVALGLGANAIQPGQTGTVRMSIPVVSAQLYTDTSGDGYVSAVFSPTWLDKKFVNGNTDLTVVFHLPPGVQNEEPRWHAAPSGFPDQPESALDDENRIVYIWRNPNATSWQEYDFGASFPGQYTPPEAVVETDLGQSVYTFIGACASFLPGLICFGLVGLIIFASVNSGRKRKLQYLPPKVAIEGHGIKRGLTAVEAAVLMEQPVDKILTMILFSTVKKGAASVKSRDPLQMTLTTPQPEGLHQYEIDFLQAFALEARERRKKLQDAMVNLVNSVAEKMKGFSRKESIAYYQQIIETAWKQVEAADTPEVKSAKYEEVMDWTMLDRDYDDRTRRTFSGGPVFVPVWWPHYDPSFPSQTTSAPRPAAGIPAAGKPSGGSGGGGISLPNLPGSDFAASVVKGVESFSTGVVGSLTDFTSGVTNRTNPLPKPTSTPSSTKWRGGGSSGSHHCACACACACAGCACACAGGGR